MAEIRRYPIFRHLRSEPTNHILRYHRGDLKLSGAGVAFWFTPLATAIASVPVDVRELPFLMRGRTSDFQEATIQGDIVYRIDDPEKLGTQIDFSIDLIFGTYLKQPLDQVANLLIGDAQQIAVSYLANCTLRDALSAGPAAVRHDLNAGLVGNEVITEMGINVLNVQVKEISPTPELEKALQTPTREKLQQKADEAAFERRAMAVANERAIAENELNNKIELAKKENVLIEHNGANAQKQATEEAAASTIRVENEAQSTRVSAEAESEQIRLIQGAEVQAERDRLDIYRDLTPALIVGLAAQELAGKLNTIEHINITPDMLASGLKNLLNMNENKTEG